MRLRGLQAHVRMAKSRFADAKQAQSQRAAQTPQMMLHEDSPQVIRYEENMQRLEELLSSMQASGSTGQLPQSKAFWRENLKRLQAFKSARNEALRLESQNGRGILQPAPMKQQKVKLRAKPQLRRKPDGRDSGSLRLDYENDILMASIDYGAAFQLLGASLALGAVFEAVPEDSQPSSEAQSDHPDIVALAARLKNNPVEIYNYVLNEIEYQPYYGSRLGAVGALSAERGNSWDQSSLLVALLRAAGYPARYVWGTVDVPIIEKQDDVGRNVIPDAGALNWLGVAEASAASSLLTASGHPEVLMKGVDENNDGILEPVSISKEHCWVMAQVPVTRYRGQVEDGAEEQGREWVYLDPSVKTYTYSAGVTIPCDVDFDFNLRGNDDAREYLSVWRAESPLEFMEAEIIDCLRRNPQLRCETIQQTWKQPALVRRTSAVLPASPQVSVPEDAVIEDGADFPDRFRTEVEVAIPGMSFRRSMAQLHDTSISVEYPQTSQSSESRAQIVLNAIDANRREEIPETPGAFQPFYLGGVDQHPLTVTIHYPQPLNVPAGYQTSSTHTYQVVAGGDQFFEGAGAGVHVVTLSPALVSQNEILRRSEVLANTERKDVPQNALETEALHLAGLTYLRNLERADARIGAPHHYRYAKKVFHALVSIRLHREEFVDGIIDVLNGEATVVPGDTPPGARFLVDAGEIPATYIDINERRFNPEAQSSSPKLRKMLVLAGFNANFQEHQVLEQSFNMSSISAVRGIQAAQDPGLSTQPLSILRLQQDDPTANTPQDLPAGPLTLPLSVLYGNGYTILSPEAPVAYSNGVYQVAIAIDPDTGDSRFLISSE